MKLKQVDKNKIERMALIEKMEKLAQSNEESIRTIKESIKKFPQENIL